MTNDPMETAPSISGVPVEVQKNIVEDLKKEIQEGEAKPVLKIGISISENEDLGRLGYSAVHLKDLIVEIARNLLINDMSIVYGGDLRKEGFTRIFADLAYQYRSISETKKIHFENYFSFPIYCLLTTENELEFKKFRTAIFKVPPPAGLVEDTGKFIPFESQESKDIWAKSLTRMRETMITNTFARILAGGRINDYKGAMPGIIEEAAIALQHDKPLYLIGGFGGAAAYVACAIAGKIFDFVPGSFNSYGLERLSGNNGLSRDENLRLFSSPHVSEIIYLIFKGLNNKAQVTG